MRSRIGLILAVASLVIAACSGDDADEPGGVASIDDVATTEASDVDRAGDPIASDEEAVIEFASCMRQQDVDFPDPTVDADGNVAFDLASLRSLTEMNEDDLEAAFESCVSLLAGVSFGFERIFDADFQDDLVAFAGCMRENGFDMPDPDFAALTTTGQIFPDTLDINDPDFDRAFEICQETLPGIPGLSSQ